MLISSDINSVPNAMGLKWPEQPSHGTVSEPCCRRSFRLAKTYRTEITCTTCTPTEGKRGIVFSIILRWPCSTKYSSLPQGIDCLSMPTAAQQFKEHRHSLQIQSATSTIDFTCSCRRCRRFFQHQTSNNYLSATKQLTLFIAQFTAVTLRKVSSPQCLGRGPWRNNLV